MRKQRVRIQSGVQMTKSAPSNIVASSRPSFKILCLTNCTKTSQSTGGSTLKEYMTVIIQMDVCPWRSSASMAILTTGKIRLRPINVCIIGD